MNSLRCAAVARDEGLLPLGTAGHHRGYLLVDWPLPWPKDLGDVPELAPLYAALAGTGIRLQGVVPAPGDDRNLVLHLRPGGGFAGYERVARVVGADEVVDAAVALVGAAVAAGATAKVPAAVGAPAVRPLPGLPGPGEGHGLDHAALPGAPAGDGARGDLLVCTHGKRDTCCGSLGTALHLELLADPAVAGAGYRVGRTSHTGGHRFAPTALVLPEATMWAFLDAELTARVVRRSGPVEDVLGAYRGSTGIGSPALQAVEREAFAQVGWGWLDWRRSGDDLADGRVRLTGESPQGEVRTWEAEVAGNPRPVPDCGKPLDQARKAQVEPIVLTLTAH